MSLVSKIVIFHLQLFIDLSSRPCIVFFSHLKRREIFSHQNSWAKIQHVQHLRILLTSVSSAICPCIAAKSSPSQFHNQMNLLAAQDDQCCWTKWNIATMIYTYIYTHIKSPHWIWMKISHIIRIRFLKGFFFWGPGKLFASKLPVYFDPSGHLKKNPDPIWCHG